MHRCISGAVWLAALASVSFAQSTGQEQDPPPSTEASTVQYGAADLNGDGLFDLAKTDSVNGVVEIWEGHADDTFTLAQAYQFAGAGGVDMADVNNDGFVDVVVGSYDSGAISIGYGDGSTLGLLFDAPIFVGVEPGLVAVADTCEDGFPEIIVSNSEQTTYKSVFDPTTTPSVYTVNSETTVDCGEQAGPCNNYTEPSCNPSPAYPGVQECLRAVTCRRDKCKWAACINLADGGTYLRYVVGMASCAGVSLRERADCVIDGN